MDPSPDMLTRARQAALESGVSNTAWLLGGDTDVPALGGLVGNRLAAVTIGQALVVLDRLRSAVADHGGDRL